MVDGSDLSTGEELFAQVMNATVDGLIEAAVSGPPECRTILLARLVALIRAGRTNQEELVTVIKRLGARIGNPHPQARQWTALAGQAVQAACDELAVMGV